MAQLRQDYESFVAKDAEVIVIGPDSVEALQRFWHENAIPFVGLADPQHRVADRYRQEVNVLKLGRMPAQFIIDKAGQIRYQHYSQNMADIPANAEMLAILASLSGSSG